MWPVVTAYGLRAAIGGRNVAVADAAYATLMRGAALNMSNMENLEWLSGQPLLLDEAHPNLIGPVINSKRQLWSVGGYLGMVIRDVFGVSTTREGIEVKPFVTAKLRGGVFAAGDSIALYNLRLQGRAVNVKLRLPPVPAAGTSGYYAVERILVDGKPAGSSIPWSALDAHSDIEVQLGKLVDGATAIRRVSADPYAETPTVFGPREPRIDGVARAGGTTTVTIVPADQQAGITYNIYRDGKLVASNLGAGTWTDRENSAAACYAAEAQYTSSGNRSHHSVPRCAGASVAIAATDPRVDSRVAIAPGNARFAEAHLANWGQPADRLDVRDVHVPQAGDYAVQVRYHNGANQINLGISGGVKWLALKDESGRIVAQGVVQLPHARIEKANTPTVYSTPLAARLKANVAYRIGMSDFYNMSYLDSNRSFSAAGGVDGPSNRFDIYGVRLLRTNGTKC
jgi:hypothetical protein